MRGRSPSCRRGGGGEDTGARLLGGNGIGMAEALTFLPSMLVTAYACVSPATKKTSVARNSSSAGISGPCSTPRSRPPPAVSTRWARASSKARRTVVPLSNRMKGGVRRMPGGEATSWCLGEQRSVWCVNCGRESTRSLPPFPRPTTRGKGQRPGAGPVGVKAPCESTRCLTTTTPYPLGRGGEGAPFLCAVPVGVTKHTLRAHDSRTCPEASTEMP